MPAPTYPSPANEDALYPYQLLALSNFVIFFQADEYNLIFP